MAVEWSGWCRSSWEEEAALHALIDYGATLCSAASGLRVFDGFEQILGSTIYRSVWTGRKGGQREAIEMVCRGGEKTVCVTEVDGIAVCFEAYELNAKDRTGLVLLVAIHPDYQNRGYRHRAEQVCPGQDGGNWDGDGQKGSRQWSRTRACPKVV